MLPQANRIPALPDKFRAFALALPGQVEQALALVTTREQAVELLGRNDAVERYARRIEVDTRTANAITVAKLAIVARLGDLLAPETPQENGRRGGRGHKAPTPAVAPLRSPVTRARYRKVAAHKGKLDTYRRRALPDNGEEPEEASVSAFLRFATGTEKSGLAAHVSASTGCPEWYTPATYVEAARAVLGAIDLDPASSDVAQRTVKAARYFTLDDDGLARGWAGRAWLNPPYAAGEVERFVGKLCGHVRAGEVPAAILLANNATETRWLQEALGLARAVCFPRGRIKFLDEEGNPSGAPLQGQAVLYFGPERARFVARFKEFGACAPWPGAGGELTA
jgi:ParB family chromosome partitioning protein